MKKKLMIVILLFIASLGIFIGYQKFISNGYLLETSSDIKVAFQKEIKDEMMDFQYFEQVDCIQGQVNYRMIAVKYNGRYVFGIFKSRDQQHYQLYYLEKDAFDYKRLYDEKLQLAITIGPLYSQQIQTIQYSFMEDTPLIIDVSQQQYVIAIASSPVDDVVNVEMLCDGVIIPITKIEYIE